LRVLRLDVGVDVVQLPRPSTSEIEVSEQPFTVLPVVPAQLLVNAPRLRRVAAGSVVVELVFPAVLPKPLSAPTAFADELQDGVDVLVGFTQQRLSRARA